MACTQEYIDFVCSQLDGVGIVEARKMFGDWCIYIDEKPVILACDNLCYVKKIPELSEMMNNAECGCPYPGAKEHYLLDVEHRGTAIAVARILVATLPYPKPKAKKKK